MDAPDGRAIRGTSTWIPAACAGAAADAVAATPVLSARRAPETLARPVAARNLRNCMCSNPAGTETRVLTP